MKDLGKVSTKQVFQLWRNLTVCLLAVVAVLVFSKILPYYLSPVIALLVSAALYMYAYNEKATSASSCIIPTISILYSLVGYAFLTIILNLMHVWGLFEMPHEFVFFTDPFIPALILSPMFFIVISIIYLRHGKMKMCVECRASRSFGGRRSAFGILNSESHNQLKNFIWISGILTLVVWGYYEYLYINVNISSRDSYIFTWLAVIVVVLDELYFSFRYYNLYLDLQEHDELISPSELNDMTAKTYIRFYVICGDSMYLCYRPDSLNPENSKVIDTPFFTKQTMNGILAEDVKKMIERMTGVDNGELRFFYGRKSPINNKNSLLRYFYFLDGTPEDYPELETQGFWYSFDKVKYIYSNAPQKMGELAVYDITRLATIMLTEKIFDEKGFRKSGIKSYNPTFNLREVRKSPLDFQDDKWIKISLFNSDTRMFKLKRWWKNKIQKSGREVG